jgi:hypothetical protein
VALWALNGVSLGQHLATTKSFEMECLVRQVHGHQVNLETVKVGLWVKELVLVLVQALLVWELII